MSPLAEGAQIHTKSMVETKPGIDNSGIFQAKLTYFNVTLLLEFTVLAYFQTGKMTGITAHYLDWFPRKFALLYEIGDYQAVANSFPIVF